MKRFGSLVVFNIAALILIFSALFGLAWAEDGKRGMSQLWQKAAAYMKCQHWVPGKMVEQERTYNLKGKLEKESRLVIGFSPDNQNNIQLSLLAAEQNGKDISWRVRATLEDTVSLNDLIGDSPFRVANGQEVTSHFNGQTRQISGRTCCGFDFLFKTGEAIIEGTAWLDRKTGLPAEIHSRVISVPFMRDDLRITSYIESEYYTITDQGDCLLQRSQVDMDVAVPKRWFKGQVKTLSVCKDHWKFVSAQTDLKKNSSMYLSRCMPVH